MTTTNINFSKYQESIFDWVTKGRGDAVVQAVAGCLAGDTLIGVNRGGKSYQVRLDYLVHMINGGKAIRGKPFNKNIPTKVRSLTESKHFIIGLNEIAAAVCSGEKLTYTVKTKGGFKVRATADHQFLTKQGWVKLKDLKVGDLLLTDAGKPKKSKQKGYKPHYKRVFGLINHPYNHSDGRKGHVWLHRLIAEARLNEMSLEDFVTKIKKGQTDSLQFLNPRVWVVHHIDENRDNNHPDNLQVMTVEEHYNHHAKERGWRNVQSKVAFDAIKSIEEYGFEATYDLTMANEQCPNFLANGIVVHNSGKTFTLVEAAKLLSTNSATFVAFNKHIVKELQTRLGNAMAVKTIHSIGMSAVRSHLRRAIVDESKYFDIAKPYAQEIADDLKREYAAELRRWKESKDKDKKPPEDPPTIGYVLGQLKKLVHFTRVTLTDPDDYQQLEEMCAHYSVLENGLGLRQLQYRLKEILRYGEKIAESQGIIDYDDMLWLPWKWDLSPSKSEWVMVDESQDLSPAQLDLVLKMRGKGGRMLFCGDPRQSIYGFSGAANDSIDQIIKRTGATVLPLSICYRCPSSHIELAQEIVPQIEPRPDAPEGIIEYIPQEKVPEIIREGDLVIARCTAPVIKLCIELIARKIPARVRGRDIGKALTSIVREVAEHPEFQWSEGKFGYYLRDYQNIKIEKLLQRKNSENQIQSLRDRIDGIWVCYQAFDSKSLSEFCSEIEALFSDTRSSVVLSTVHRAKGLEEKRVFILRPDQLPLTWKNQQDWEKEQEENLRYVALTRAKESLYFITNKPPKLDEDDEDEDEDEDEEEYEGEDDFF